MMDVMKRIKSVAIGFMIMNTAVMLLPYGTFFYALSILAFALPMIIAAFSKATVRNKEESLVREASFSLYPFFISRTLSYLASIISCVAIGFVLPVMIFLLDRSEYTALMILLSLVFLINRTLIKGRSYRKEFAGSRKENTRHRIMYAAEAVAYPLIWAACKSFITDDKPVFGTVDELSNIPFAYTIGICIDFVNRIIAMLSEYATILPLLSLMIYMLVSGGIMFIGLYRYFDGYSLTEESIKDSFSPIERIPA